MTHILGRDEFLAKKDELKRETVFIKEWDASVIVRALRAKERDLFESRSVERNGSEYVANLQNIRARLVALTVVDESGNRVFGDEDESVLGEMDAGVIDQLFKVGQRLSGMSPESIEDLAKNSKPDQSASSSIN